MKLVKWGNSYGVRITTEMMKDLKWSANEELQPLIDGDGELRIVRDRRRQEALQKLRKHRVVLPEKYVFDRDEIYGE